MGGSSHVPPQVAAALAARPDLAGDAAELLCGSRQPTVRSFALRSVRSADVISGAASQGVRALASVAANRHADPDLLSRLAVHPDVSVSLRALCNISTPLEVRRRVLSRPGVAASLVAVSSPLGAQVVRAGELALSNSWMLEFWPSLPPAIVRGLSSLPECPPELLFSRAGRAPAAADHPARYGHVLADLPDDVLCASSSSAAHLELLSRPSFTAAGAARLLAGSRRRGSRRPEQQLHPEPHVLARLFRRFGSEPLLHGAPARMAGTRVSTSGWAEPYAEVVLSVCAAMPQADVPSAFAAASVATGLLGGDGAVWSVFVPLVARPHDASPLEMHAKVATVLSGRYLP